MWPDRVSNPGPLTYEPGALPTTLRGPAFQRRYAIRKMGRSKKGDLFCVIHEKWSWLGRVYGAGRFRGIPHPYRLFCWNRSLDQLVRYRWFEISSEQMWIMGITNGLRSWFEGASACLVCFWFHVCALPFSLLYVYLWVGLSNCFTTVELQWLEHLLNHENMFEIGVVRAKQK